MNFKLLYEIIIMILVHIIFYKVSIYYLMKYLDILNHSNKFNKSIFFITFLVCMSIFSLFIFELSNIVSNIIIIYIWHIDICILVLLLYLIIPVEFINTIFDSNNYKEILSPEFNSHSHIKLLKTYYTKISFVNEEQNAIIKKTKKHFFFRSIIFLSLLWLSLGELKNVIYKKNYNYVIADDNSVNIRKYLLYKNNDKKNQNKIFNRNVFFLFEKQYKCVSYFREFNSKYKKKKENGIHMYLNKIYNIINILFFMIINYFMIFHKLVIREFLINICALGVTTNSIVAGITSIYFIYDYIITFIYFLRIPKIQIQIYNIEERILINLTNYMFKKKELERLQSNLDIDSKNFLYDTKNSYNNNNNNNNSIKEEKKINKEIINYSNSKKKFSLKKVSLLLNITNKLKDICQLKNNNFLNDRNNKNYDTNLYQEKNKNFSLCKNSSRVNFNFLDECKKKKKNSNFSDHESTAINYFYKNINKKNVTKLKRSSSCPFLITENNTENLDQSNIDNHEILLTKFNSLNIASSYKYSLLITEKMNKIKKKKRKDIKNTNDSIPKNLFLKNINIPLNKLDRIKFDEYNEIGSNKYVDEIYINKKNIVMEDKEKTKKGKYNKCIDEDDILYKTNDQIRKIENIENYNKLKKEMENIIYTNTSMYYSLNAILSRKFEIQKNKNCLLGRINVCLNSFMFLTVIYKVIMSTMNVIFIRIYIRDPFSKIIEKICLFFNVKYNLAIIYAPYISLIYISYIVAINMKKFLQQIIQISTYFSSYFKLFSNMWILLISELMGLYFVTNSLLLTSYLPVNYNHIMNFVIGSNYDYKIFHLHSDYVFIMSFSSTLLFCVLYIIYFYFF
ncbi:conserved Plasmodium membrane protein, unknown function [Plasmodium gallinaceum]|uniref:Abscisic acid G-protein coupled receptor-like domain-containing protein n=1 Tax=Plasmodium gallinaceum TaxID=5849 RepID=A0A1J1GPB1_PLAGA|nr:conserved Plasmodium membrane protein, unknown function [Plasmodium gallinaceum]CRG94142.1 conserved Plasmodium membrane protein, unknown function [Plasmodium gallinaceum]